MLEFWRNPEFMRHRRAELRPARLGSAVAITYIVMALIGMAVFNRDQPTQELYRAFYGIIAILAPALLVLWCLSVGSQAVAGERELKTFDFLRTTRLSSAELLVGKLLGAPVMAYVIYACALTVIIPAGLLAGFSLGGILITIVLSVCLALLLGLTGIWVSMLVEKMNRGVGVLAFFFLWPLLAIGATPMRDSYLPAAGCISPYPAIAWAHGEWRVLTGTGTVPVFGIQLPYAIVTLLLYASIGGWLGLMIVRNFKKDLEEVRLLTRWQAIGFAFYLNLLFYAFIDLNAVTHQHNGALLLTYMGITVTGATTALVGLFTLSPPERLKVWERQRVAGATEYLSEDGLPWPWMIVAGAMGFAMLAVQAIAIQHLVPLYTFELPTASICILLLVTFAMRDVLFLQWCKLTRMKSPVVKGVLFLFLYYFAAGTVISIAYGAADKQGLFAMRVLTPVYYFDEKEKATAAAAMLTGVAVQGAVVAVLLAAIMSRLKRTLAIAQA
jgi:hypothetical protein